MGPLNIDDYLSHGGFDGLKKALREMKPGEVVKTILESGLRGRGGGGFMTGKKWEIVAGVDQKEKYVICNGDEGSRRVHGPYDVGILSLPGH